MRPNGSRYFIVFGLVAWAAIIVCWEIWLYRLPADISPETPSGASFDPNSIVFAGALQDGIPAIDEPMFETVGAADVYLQDALQGLAVEADGQWRFYPYQILVWHGAVNDDFNGLALLVTYCPLCHAGAVFERDFLGEALSFGVTGQVSDNNLLLYDRASQSLWSQLRGRAVLGDKAGTELDPYPSTVMTWSHFKQAHPSGQVLSRDTGAERDYTHNPYGDYLTNNDILFPLSHADGRLKAKTLVYGLADGEASWAAPAELIRSQRAVNADVGALQAVFLYDEDADAVYAFSRRSDTDTYTISWNGEAFVDAETGSTWSADGRAVVGTFKGRALHPLSTQAVFWFCWAAVHPETTVYEF